MVLISLRDLALGILQTTGEDEASLPGERKADSVHWMKRTTLTTALLALPAFVLLAGSALGPDWDGDCGKGDAGNKPSNAVPVSLGFTLEVRTVKGCLDGPSSEEGLAGETQGDYQDMYKVVVRSPGQFEIETSGPEGSTDFNSLLCVFDLEGRPLLANISGEQGQDGSAVGNQSTNGKFSINRPGAIYISISGADSRPIDANGNQLFDFTADQTDVVGPVPGDVLPIFDWDQPGQYGEYTIALTAVGPIPPECGAENTSACDQVHALPFCDVPECCESVCSVDFHCCDDTWDAACVTVADLVCNDGNAGCGRVGAGPCDVPHPNVFCDDAACCAQVCFLRPFCCEVGWDQACVNLALNTCPPPCNLECPQDLTQDGIVGGADLATLLGTWGQSGCGDFDSSGTVDGADLATLLAVWNDTCE